MKYNLPCEILKDLLPNYIDGLSSKVTAEAVEEHLENCADCKKTYELMKKDCRSSSAGEQNIRQSEGEKELFRKINKKLNRRTKTAVIAGIAAVIAVLGAVELLFNAPLKNIPVGSVSAAASVYPMEQLASPAQEGQDYSVKISKSENEEQPYFVIEIPDSNYTNIGVSESVLDSCAYVSLISWESPYILKDIDYEYKTENGESVLYVTAFKSTILNNSTSSMSASVSTIQFEKTDKIIYLDKNGNQTVMWENK